MATIPVAKPSKPSIRFIALANSTTHKTVANAARSGVSNTTSTKGILRTTKETPTSDKTLPAMTIPAIFAGAVIGFTSSITPTAHITTADKRTPNISDCEEKTAEKSPISHAASEPANSPNSIAGPPRFGVGDSCTSLSSGAEIISNRLAAFRASGVATNVAIAATPPTMK